jgi:hypothetical protein
MCKLKANEYRNSSNENVVSTAAGARKYYKKSDLKSCNCLLIIAVEMKLFVKDLFKSMLVPQVCENIIMEMDVTDECPHHQ